MRDFDQEADIVRAGIAGNEGSEFPVEDDDIGFGFVDGIIGGSDVGKTTILEVITLLLSVCLLSVWKDSGFTNPEDYFVRILPIRARQPLGRCRTGPYPPVEAEA